MQRAQASCNKAWKLLCRASTTLSASDVCVAGGKKYQDAVSMSSATLHGIASQSGGNRLRCLSWRLITLSTTTMGPCMLKNISQPPCTQPIRYLQKHHQAHLNKIHCDCCGIAAKVAATSVNTAMLQTALALQARPCALESKHVDCFT